jgi:ornithine carbamoyltransferase
LYPNPNNGIFTLSYNLEKEITEADVVITDVTGKLMYQDKLDIENHNINLKLQNVQSGIYFVQLVNQNNKLLWTDKVIISK